MHSHNKNTDKTIETMAEEQVLFLRNRYHMDAREIVYLYTGKRVEKASYIDAIQSITAFNAQNALKNGFIVN